MTAADNPGSVPVVPFVSPESVSVPLPVVERVEAVGDPVFERAREVAAAAVSAAVSAA